MTTPGPLGRASRIVRSTVTCTLALLCLTPLAVPLAAQQGGDDWLLVPGERVGPITARWGEVDVIERFGAAAVTRQELYLGEGDAEEATVLFAGTADEVAIVWKATASRRCPGFAIVSGRGARWRTPNGIGVGTSLRELETLNGGAFAFSGFGHSYEGIVESWEGGALAATHGPDRFRLRLAASGEPGEWPEAEGDRRVLSGSDAARALELSVDLVEVRWGTPYEWTDAEMAGDCGGAPATGSVRLEGSVHDPLGRPVRGLGFEYRSARHRASTAVAVDGSFALTVPAPARGDSIDLIIDARDPANRAWHPVLLRIGGHVPDDLEWWAVRPPDTLVHVITVALVPTRWTIPAGTHAGTTVPISLQTALEPNSADGRALYYRGRRGSVVGASWDDARLPVAVVFDRTRSHHAITARDSIALWASLDSMEAAWGVDLWRPARFRPHRGDERPFQVEVRIDTTLAERGAAHLLWWGYTDDAGAGWYRPRDAYWAEVALRDSDLLSDAWLVSHEMGHVLGHDHTCGIESVMAKLDLCPRATTPVPTAADVAYDQVRRAVVSLRLRDPDIRYGLESARVGERVLVHGLPPYDQAR